MRRILGVAAVLAVATALAGQATAAPRHDHLTPGQRQALSAGIQVAPKGAPTTVSGRPLSNPYLSYYGAGVRPDYFAWNKKMRAAAAKRAASPQLAAARRAAVGSKVALPPAIVHDEQEPAGTSGSNDSIANAEPIPEFGTAAGKHNRLRVLGALADLLVSSEALDPVPEDNGSIPLAGDTGISGEGAVTTTGVLGDGPHGSSGDGTNDFDVYAIDAAAGATILGDTSQTTSGVDTILALYDADGELVAADDDSGGNFTSVLTYAVPQAGTYYLLVGGYSDDGPLPLDPNDSGSGAGGADEGAYALTAAAKPTDQDYYKVRLRAGDVLGGVGNGGATQLQVFRANGAPRVGSQQFVDPSSLYPPSSPLPGGGNTTFAYVAEATGWYAVKVDGATAAYDVTLEAYRPGTEQQKPRKRQTVFLDFDGERVNTAVWGGPGVRTLSPFASFLGKWGLTRAQEGTLINKITAEVTENLKTDMIQQGLNKQFDLKVVNSRNSPDVYGQPNVSRVIVGGTIDESGIPTIGVAQYIDPGNFGLEDQAVVLLDVMSDDGQFEDSLNHYLTSASNRVDFVAQAVGNVVSHEAGHLVGNYHTDNESPVVNLEDAGGANYDNLYGVGPDGVGGTADDLDVDFRTDDYDPFEGFLGKENTFAVVDWAYVFK